MPGTLLEWKIPASECVPDNDSVLRRFRTSRGGPDVSSEILPVIPRLAPRIKALGGFSIFPIHADSARQLVEVHANDNVLLLSGEMITPAFEGASHCAVFAASIGEGVEKEGERLSSQGNILQGYFADLFGSAAAERAAEFVHERVREYAVSEGMGSGNRYSPGYCGWDVSDQHKLFSLFPAGFCGISLKDSSMMVPVKSVSGIIPLGAGVVHKPYLCAVCTRKGCIYKK
jgi:hypothetical protein